MSLTRASKQYLGVRATAPPNLQLATRPPTSADKAYLKGNLWLDTVALTAYMWPGSGNWIALGSGTTGAIVTLTGGSGGALSPTAGNMNLLGTANQITSTGSGSTITFSLPSAITAPGSLTTTTSLTAGSGFTVTAGTSSLKATTIVGTTLINASGAAVTTIGTGGTGAVNIGNATGNTAVTGSLTATTTLTATLGDITATNGNFVSSASGKGLSFNSPAASGVAANPVVVNGRSGQATFTTVSIAAAADLTLTITNSAISGATTQVLLSRSGGTTGSALSIKSVTPSAGSLAIVVTNGTGATTSTADIVINFLVLN